MCDALSRPAPRSCAASAIGIGARAMGEDDVDATRVAARAVTRDAEETVKDDIVT